MQDNMFVKVRCCRTGLFVRRNVKWRAPGEQSGKWRELLLKYSRSSRCSETCRAGGLFFTAED